MISRSMSSHSCFDSRQNLPRCHMSQSQQLSFGSSFVCSNCHHWLTRRQTMSYISLPLLFDDLGHAVLVCSLTGPQLHFLLYSSVSASVSLYLCFNFSLNHLDHPHPSPLHCLLLSSRRPLHYSPSCHSLSWKMMAISTLPFKAPLQHLLHLSFPIG